METEKREQEPGQLGAEIEKEIKAQSVSEKDSNFTIETKIKREQLKKEYESADAARRRQIAEELKKLESELSLEARAERLKGLKIEVTGFTKAIKEAAEDPNKRENVPWLDDEEMAVYLKKCIPGIFHEFFEKHCKFIYDPTVENDTVMPKAKGEKIIIIAKATVLTTRSTAIIKSVTAKIKPKITAAIR
ncbi:MAG: hypothetical protein NT135_02605 [Candidatus Berkelbacteria bacterium]|nr:hypothetical protein [Candidatus Berkelbacteria bacterium]